MRVRTSIVIQRPPDEVWPLLCSSKMDPRMPCLFRLGIPKPVECRLPDGVGGAGQRRECVSDRGVVRQRITHWEAPRLLRFRMEDTTLYFRPCVTGIEEEFLLEPLGAGATRLTRTTEIAIIGFCRWGKAIVMGVGMKFVHRYVFRNWKR